MTDYHTLGPAFLEGIGLVLSPCVLAILPLILAAGVDGKRKRPFGIFIGFILAFSLFSLFSRQLVLLLGVDINFLRQASYGLLIVFGLILYFTKLSEEFGEITQRFTTTGEQIIINSGTGWFSGLLVGGAIGLIWVPCPGPILAPIIVQTVAQAAPFQSFLILLLFSLGVGVPMLILTYAGRWLLGKLAFFKYHAAKIRKLLGLIIIVTVLITSGWIFSYAPVASSPSGLTQNPLIPADGKLVDGIPPYPAPKIIGIDAWVNSSVLALKDLDQKVVLVNFWTYSCVNCVRTIPHLNELYTKYHDQGLEVIGVHSPEFAFEKKILNVMQVIEAHNIKYPVALDSQFKTWKNYDNHYWPAYYLIDKAGNVVYVHFGEGGYDVMEKNVRYLLGLEDNTKPIVKPKTKIVASNITKKIYFGASRVVHFGGSKVVKDKLYHYPRHLRLHHWALKGKWHFNEDEVTSLSTAASLKLNFRAKKVFLVMGTEKDIPIKVTVKFNGQPMTRSAGADVKDSTISVTQPRLYELVSVPNVAMAEVEIISQAPGLQIYALSFE